MAHLPLPLQGHYDDRLVALSVFIAILAAYAALDLAGRVTSAHGRARSFWLSGGAVAMGTGIWSMHYIGMEALRLPVRVDYDWPTVLVSLLAAVGASGIALFLVSRKTLGKMAVAIGSIAMGSGIAGMHYIGMAAMRLPAMCTFSIPLVTLSVVLAIVISAVALSQTFRFRGETADWGWRKTASAVVMGSAIPVMHYVGMAAATFYPMPLNTADLRHAVSISTLGISAITLVSLVMLGLVFVLSIVDRRFSLQAMEIRSGALRYRQIVETAFDAFVGFDAALLVEHWNPQAERMFGWTKTEAAGRPLGDFLLLDRKPADTARTLPGLLDANDNAEMQARMEVVALRRDGRQFAAEMAISSVQTGAKKLFAAFIQDVTERKDADRERESAKEAAEAASRAKGEFLANMSHEIRTPLNGVIGMTELALQTDLTREQREYLDTVRFSAESLLTVINDILDFSKIEAGKIELETVDFDLRECLETTLRTLALRADEKGLELLCDVRPEVPEQLRGDSNRLRQVLMNLLGNAIKFTHTGEVALKVGCREPEHGKCTLQCEVSDTGIGIAPGKLESVFHSFSQADASTTREYGGTGLGLTISRSLVEMMGGRIWVESVLGKGSSFHFTVELEPGEKPAHPTNPASSQQSNVLDGIRVLVVDDNRTNRRILEGLLAGWGMEPELASDGEGALAALHASCEKGSPFQLVLTDMHMPKMDGFELIERIRDEDGTRAATIVMLTSGGHRGDAARCEALGVAAYLLKPIRQAELREAIARVLGAMAENRSAHIMTRESLEIGPRITLRVLLAEDNEVNQKLARRLLEKRGHQVVVVRNGLEALDAVRREPFDLVLMDVHMPEMDGIEATQLLRAEERETNRHQAIVAMTALVMKGDRERCLEAGMDGYLPKPIRSQELDQVLERYTAQKQHSTAPESASPVAANGHSIAAGAAPSVNSDDLLDRIGGDRGFLAELLETFREDHTQQMDNIRAALETRDAVQLMHTAHSLKGALSNLAAPTAAALAADIEGAAKASDFPRAGTALRMLEPELARVLETLDALCQGALP
ncbi:MAG: response regulator [Acidobacteriaceae bacterium]